MPAIWTGPLTTSNGLSSWIRPTPKHTPAWDKPTSRTSSKPATSRQSNWLRLRAPPSIALDPLLVAAQLCGGNSYGINGEHSKALGAYQIALNLDPDNAEALIGLASAHEALGNYGTAESTYSVAIEQERLHWVTYSSLGSFYNRRGRHEQALEQFDVAVELMPSNGIAHRNRGAVLIELGRSEEALEALRTARRLRPNDPTIISNLWIVSFRLGLWDEAIENLEVAVGLGDDYRVTGNLARAYYMAKRFEEARGTYDLAIEQGMTELAVNPDNPDVHVLMARYYAMQDKKAEALDHLDFALSSRPEDGHYHVIAATVYNQFGNTDEALNLLEKAVALGGTLAEIRVTRELDNLRENPRYRRLLDSQ